MAKSEDIRKQIEAAEDKLNELIAGIDQLRPAAMEELSTACRVWISNQVAKTIESKPHMIDALGMDRLRAFKLAIEAISTDVQAWYIKNHQHYSEDEEFYSFSYRMMVGQLGSVLADYGFDSLQSSTSDWKRTNGLWHFAYGPHLEPKMTPTISKVQDLERSEKSTKAKLTGLQKQLDGARALELFESA